VPMSCVRCSASYDLDGPSIVVSWVSSSRGSNMLRYLLEVDVPNEDGADLVCTVPQILEYQVEIVEKKPVSLGKRGR
jgi:hypothetical protein